MNRLIFAFSLLFVALGVSACDEESSVKEPTMVKEPQRVQERKIQQTERPITYSPTVPQPLIDRMRFHLCRDLKLDDPDKITVQKALAVTWRNGAIGCPKPGMGYTEALVPGHYVALEHNGVTYHYHSSPRGATGEDHFFRCDNLTRDYIVGDDESSLM